jgi:hypothetical protein
MPRRKKIKLGWSEPYPRRRKKKINAVQLTARINYGEANNMLRSKRSETADINLVFGIAALGLGGALPRNERSSEVKKNLNWLRSVKRDVLFGLGLIRQNAVNA